MNIEYAKLKDVVELAKMDLIAYSEFKGWSPNSKSDFRNIIKKSKQPIILAKEKRNIVGYASLRIDKKKKWVWLENLYVLKEWRKKGVARYLIKGIINYHHKKTPKKGVVLLTADRNLDIFKKLGFQKTMNFMEYKG